MKVKVTPLNENLMNRFRVAYHKAVMDAMQYMNDHNYAPILDVEKRDIVYSEISPHTKLQTAHLQSAIRAAQALRRAGLIELDDVIDHVYITLRSDTYQIVFRNGVSCIDIRTLRGRPGKADFVMTLTTDLVAELPPQSKRLWLYQKASDWYVVFN